MVSDHGVARRVGFVEPVPGERFDEFEYLFGGGLADALQDDDAAVDARTLAELERAQREIAELLAIIKAAEADDLKAEAIKWRRAYEDAMRKQSESMDAAKRAEAREAWATKQLRRCGKAVGQADPDKIAPAVEAFVRAHAKVAA